MPMYEYVCNECQELFEKLIPMSQADKPQVCPKCGGTHANRQLSSFAVGGGSRSSSGLPARPASSPFT
ncbi:MAG: zinc ribbon domain-containing protein [Caldilineaceae bacterium]|nr:zinc ribbon domain-containing protein [Caldilineaceae bacterium]